MYNRLLQCTQTTSCVWNMTDGLTCYVCLNDKCIILFLSLYITNILKMEKQIFWEIVVKFSCTSRYSWYTLILEISCTTVTVSREIFYYVVVALVITTVRSDIRDAVIHYQNSVKYKGIISLCILEKMQLLFIYCKWIVLCRVTFMQCFCYLLNVQ